MDDLTAERYAPRRRQRPRPADRPDWELPPGYAQIEKRRRILIGKELPEDLLMFQDPPQTEESTA